MAITTLKQHNIGGAFKLRIVNAQKIDTFPDIINNEFALPDLALSYGVDWDDWIFRPENLEFNEENIGEAGDDSFTASVTGQIPKDRSDILTEIDTMNKKRWVVLVYFNNSISGARQIICIGSKSEPASFIRGRRSGGKMVVDFNGNEFMFRTTGRQTRSPFVTI